MWRVFHCRLPASTHSRRSFVHGCLSAIFDHDYVSSVSMHLSRDGALSRVHDRVRFFMNFSYLLPIVLLCCSNVFMTFAWYGQLKYPNASLWLIIPASWGIAFFEYCFAVPAN